MRMLDDLHANGQTIILVTHEDYIAAHASRSIRLRDGLIESDISAAAQAIDPGRAVRTMEMKSTGTI
jgi:ABC-type lipoprotein export system ATPase subunit